MRVFTDRRMTQHAPGAGHPDRPERLEAALAGLAQALGDGQVAPTTPEAAPESALRLVHDAAHVDLVERARGKAGQFDADTPVSVDSVPAAYLAAGAALGALDAVAPTEDDVAWAVVRPPGHHAEAHVPMGFCLFNNAAVAAGHAASLGRRVAVVDIDVHHGNGTQHMFEARDDVLFVSLHQHPFYPGTGLPDERGTGRGVGFTVNVALPRGCGDADYDAAFDTVVVPVLERFAPEILIVSAGFDAHRDDPLGGMAVSADGYATMAARMRELRRPTVLVLEGGYDLSALTESVAATARAWTGHLPRPASRPARPPSPPPSVSDGAAEAIAATQRVHGRHWGL
ncbi:MAG: histone deacetylase [Myxococcota bacterium]